MLNLVLCSTLAITPPPQVDPETQAILIEMESEIRSCVQPTSGQRVFDRCYDTHSSIHAHWAVYRTARAVPSLMPTALASDAALEYSKVQHEMLTYINYPYARAWFLRLVTEFEKWSFENGRPDPHRLRSLGDEVALDMLINFSQNPPNPLSVDYGNAAWGLTQLHQYLRWTGDQTSLATVDGWIAQHFLVDISGTTFVSDLNSARFFSTFGNWHHLIHSTQDAATRAQWWSIQDPIVVHSLVVNETSSFAHSKGLSWSRLWALRGMMVDAPTAAERRRFHRSAAEHVKVGMERHWMFEGNFGAYDHWVPQFAIYGVTQGLGF